MKALLLFDKLRKTPQTFNMLLDLDTPEELAEVLSIDCEDTSEDLFFLIRDWFAFQSI